MRSERVVAHVEPASKSWVDAQPLTNSTVIDNLIKAGRMPLLSGTLGDAAAKLDGLIAKYGENAPLTSVGIFERGERWEK